VAAEEVIATGQLETVLRPQTGHLRLGWGNIEVKLPMPMAMQQEPIDWRNLPYIRPIFQAYIRGYPHKIWPHIWYVYVPRFIGSRNSPSKVSDFADSNILTYLDPFPRLLDIVAIYIYIMSTPD
jgi:hypothetical protein